MCARSRASGGTERAARRTRSGGEAGGWVDATRRGVGTRQRDTRTMRRTRAVSREARASDPRRAVAGTGGFVGRRECLRAWVRRGAPWSLRLARLPRAVEPCRRPSNGGAPRRRRRLGFFREDESYRFSISLRLNTHIRYARYKRLLAASSGKKLRRHLPETRFANFVRRVPCFASGRRAVWRTARDGVGGRDDAG